MKKISLLTTLIIFSVQLVQAQLTGMTPVSGVHGQQIQTSITSNGLFMSISSPSGNLFEIKLIGSSATIPIFDLGNFYFNAAVAHPDTVLADFIVPVTVPDGVYELSVTIGEVWDPWSNQQTYTLPGAFTVLPPDGYITGAVYEDLNKNGVKDAGEPGIAGRNIKLMPTNFQVLSDANGEFSFPAVNGNYSVILTPITNPFMYITSSNDTLPVTINNANVPGTDFGLKNALISVTPDFGYKGITTTHQIVADEPVFGTVGQIFIYTNPGISVPLQNITVVNNYTIQFTVAIPANTPVSTDVDIRIYISSGPNFGYHYLRDQFDVLVPPVFISGRLFFDQNQDKVNDPGEPGIVNGKLLLSPDSSISFSDYAGNYLMGSLGGTQVLSYENNIPGLVLFTDSTTYTFNSVGVITGKDFGFISTEPDYSVHTHSLYLFPRCFSQQIITFYVRNNGNIPFNAIAWIKFGPLLNFVSTPFPGATVSNDTIYFPITNLLPYSQVQRYAMFNLPGPGNTININTGASSLDGNGVVQLTHTSFRTFTVLCAFDPNDKQVTPPGIFTENFTLMSDTLEYLIRFQNTGNDTAFKVVIVDTLDINLDRNSFEVTGSSHSVQTEVETNGKVTFTFNDIMLVDSVANEPESHGYVKYRIMALPGLADSTEINNTAHIFFDFNPAVVTNTTLNTLVFVLPVGISEALDENDGVLFYPNPFNESATLLFKNPEGNRFTLQITDLLGKTVAQERSTTGNSFVVDKNKLVTGTYFYRLINTKNSIVRNGKFMVE